MQIRAMTTADLPAVLALNEPWKHWTSELTAERLAELHGWSGHARVVENDDGVLVGFLLGFREGCDYDGLNYRWFAARYDRFLYVDRLVVDASQQGKGLGAKLYDDAFAAAVAGDVPLVTCEIDKRPPNPNSFAFHERMGFGEVDEFELPSGKVVSMQAKSVGA